jgi:hypothetical protein
VPNIIHLDYLQRGYPAVESAGKVCAKVEATGRKMCLAKPHGAGLSNSFHYILGTSKLNLNRRSYGHSFN